MPYLMVMQTFIETNTYLRAAKGTGMSEAEMFNVLTAVAENPLIGDIMTGCGGARKFRFAKSGGGKSGGYRVVSYFAGDDVPAFFLTVFPKNAKTNLTKAEQNIFAAAVKRLRDSLKGD